MIKVGDGYTGSDKIEISVENENIIPEGYVIYKISFYNDEECVINVNNETEIFLRAGQGFQTEVKDRRITNLSIKQSGVSYNWIGAYYRSE